MTTLLRQRRRELDLSQDELAERLQCSQASISNWEIGSSPIAARKPRKMLEAMFDCTAADLEKETTSPQKDEAASSPNVPPLVNANE